ncbi:hypothetical protein ACLKA6_018341 [Drosophila palustris]
MHSDKLFPDTSGKYTHKRELCLVSRCCQRLYDNDNKLNVDIDVDVDVDVNVLVDVDNVVDVDEKLAIA